MDVGNIDAKRKKIENIYLIFLTHIIQVSDTPTHLPHIVQISDITKDLFLKVFVLHSL